jgi:hypothetical protein
MSTLADRIAEMQTPVPGRKYYAVTLTATHDGKLHWASQSGFAGKTDDNPPRELRAPCEVIPERMRNLWLDLGQPSIVVNDDRDFAVYLLIGGNALIQSDMAERRLPFIVKPSPVAPDGLFGMVSLSQVPRDQLQRAPTPKRRMAVLRRDDFRCQVCGRRATDYVDVELNVHHVRPWGHGGLTKENNLVTLCRTCHKGLDPHFDLKLFELVPSAHELGPNAEEMRKELFEGIKHYRKKVFSILAEKRRSNKASEATSEPAPGTASSAPPGSH